MIRNCVICGKTFTPHSNNQKTCSKECRHEQKKRSDLNDAKQAEERDRVKHDTRV